MSKQASQKTKRTDSHVTTRPISYRIADFVQWNNRDELRLSPEFQRLVGIRSTTLKGRAQGAELRFQPSAGSPDDQAAIA